MNNSASASRRTWNRVMNALVRASAVLVIVLVAGILGMVLVRGIPHISWKFLTTTASVLKGTDGILPAILNTLYVILLTLLIVLPLGVGAAVYLTEYAQNRKVISVIEFTNETLAGIPSIIYGLVGMLVFAQTLGFQTCLLSGSLTLVIMNLPTIIRTTQESLKTVPQGYREGALGLGAGKWHIIHTIVLPCSIDGIVTGCILAVGRIVGESAALLFTAGAAEVIAKGVVKAYTSNGATLSVLLYLRAFEDGDFASAWANRCRAAGAGAGHRPGRPAGQDKTETEAVKIKRYSMENTKVPVISAKNLNLWYGDFKALKHISLDVGEREITALIGPSGCGKSTFLKTLNRMNDLVPGVRIEGDVRLKGQDIFAREMQPTELRRRVGMVFQKANPFPMSIYDNITYGPRLHGVHNKAELDELVESSLQGAALWNEVKDRLKKSALGLSGGQQQRLCIARALAVKPEVLLMDEPTSALDPGSTMKVEELMSELKKNYTVVIVTHNMQQAARISDRTAFFLLGELVEAGPTTQIFSTPQDKRTEDYISGRFG